MINITDIPIKQETEDSLKIEDYQNALFEYIKNSETPMTISIQGEWGSGKTSLMNLLKVKLKNQEDNKQTPIIWINTWEYSVIGEDFAAINVFQSIISQMLKFINDNDKNIKSELKKRMDNIKGIALNIGKGISKIAVAYALKTNVGEATDDVFNIFDSDKSITKLKEELSNLADEILKLEKFQHSDKLVFFIDDLDRLNPEIAIKVLEILKNIFDIPKCLFVLAIDYEVIVKGLRAKFGDKDVNEREYRQFFDKLIQLPFSLPVGRYNSENYIKDLIANEKIKYFTKEEFEEKKNKEYLMKIVNYSVGGNPRALKRMANYLSLINGLIKSDTDKTIDLKLIHFTLIAIQIVYPFIYRMLAQEPDFPNWDTDTFNLNKIELPSEFQEKPEFDEPWEVEVYKAIALTNNKYFLERSFDISLLLNSIKDQFNETKSVDLIRDALSVTSITDVGMIPNNKDKNKPMNDYWKKLVPLIDGVTSNRSKIQTINLNGTKWKIKIAINLKSTKISLIRPMQKKTWSNIYENAQKLEIDDPNITFGRSNKDETAQNRSIWYEVSGGDENFDTNIIQIVEKYKVLKDFAENNS